MIVRRANRSRRERYPGLTLVELLAALLILSTASTAGIRILRQSTGAAREAQRMLAAEAVYDQWRRAAIRDPNTALPWSCTDENGADWIVFSSGAHPAGAFSSTDPNTGSPAPQTATQATTLLWRRISVSLLGNRATEQGFTVAFVRLERTPASANRSGAGASEASP